MIVPLGLLRRISRKVRDIQIAHLGAAPSWRKVGRGFLMLIDPRAGMDLAYYFGVFEPGLMQLIDVLVKTNDRVVDIGTHKGFVTLNLACAVGSNGSVLAIDADPRVFNQMEANCRRNGYAHVRCLPYAVSDLPGVCDFSLTTHLGNSSRYPNEIARPDVASVISVEMKKLDDIFAESGLLADGRGCSFVKIDAEGSELLILRGMRRVLGEYHPALYFEINKGSLLAGGFNVDDIEELLRSAGYEIYKISWNRTWPFPGRLSLACPSSLGSEVSGCFEIVAIDRNHSGWSRIQELVQV